MQFIIRLATPQDGPFVRDFVFATLRGYGIEPDPDGLDADVVNFGKAGDGPILELVAEAEAQAVGSVVISYVNPKEAHLSKFFVNPLYRGYGIGRALMARAIEAGRARGYQMLKLETRTIYQ